jgi:hypothetical protein
VRRGKAIPSFRAEVCSEHTSQAAHRRVRVSMDRSELSEAIIAEMETVVRAGLEETVPALLDADRATMEQRVQHLGRVIFGRLIAAVAVQRDQDEPAGAGLSRLRWRAAAACAVAAPARAGGGLPAAADLLLVRGLPAGPGAPG